MTQDNTSLASSPVEVDADCYVIDAPPAPEPQLHGEPVDVAALRETFLQLAEHAPPPRLYWTVPLEFDIDWADD